MKLRAGIVTFSSKLEGQVYISTLQRALDHNQVEATLLPHKQFHEYGDRAHHHLDVLDIHWIEYLLNRKNRKTLVLSFLKLINTLRKLRGSSLRLNWTVHNMRPHDTTYPLIYKMIFALLARYFDSFTVFTAAQKRHVCRRFGAAATKVHIIPIPNFAHTYPEVMTKHQARKSLGIADDAFVYLFFGKIRPYKQVERLTTAFTSICEERDVLLIAGSGTVTKELEESCHHKQILSCFDYIPDEDVQKYFCAADTTVYPYARCTNSASLITSMTFGTPSITSDQCMAGPDVLNNKRGLIYKGDQLEAALVLMKTLDLATMAEHCREYASSCSENSTGALYRNAYLGKPAPVA